MNTITTQLGIEVEVKAALDPVIWTYDRGQIRLLPYLCNIMLGVPSPLEHERIHWCAPEDFASLAWAAADLPVLEQLRLRAAAVAEP